MSIIENTTKLASVSCNHPTPSESLHILWNVKKHLGSTLLSSMGERDTISE